MPQSLRWEWSLKTNSFTTLGLTQMKISTTTSITLTAAEIQEAVKQFIQANGYELDDKDVEFVSDLPQEIIVKATELTVNQTKEQSVSPTSSIKQKPMDYSTYGATFTRPLINALNEEQQVIASNEVANRPFNPFADVLQSQPLNDSSPYTKASARIDGNTDTSRINESPKPVPSRRLFD